MDSKFFVSYEAAKLLKEKGYDDEYITFYNENGELIIPYDKEEYHVLYPCPTKSEALDWLESKGIIVGAYYNLNTKWGFTIVRNNFEIHDSWCHDELMLPTRLEAEDAGIKKALEIILEKGE